MVIDLTVMDSLKDKRVKFTKYTISYFFLLTSGIIHWQVYHWLITFQNGKETITLLRWPTIRASVLYNQFNEILVQNKHQFEPINLSASHTVSVKI